MLFVIVAIAYYILIYWCSIKQLFCFHTQLGGLARGQILVLGLHRQCVLPSQKRSRLSLCLTVVTKLLRNFTVNTQAH